MNFEGSENESNMSQKRLSGSSYITAWQIQSTLNNMEQFISIIQKSVTQRHHLQTLLPQIARIKKYEDEKQSLTKELKDLSKINLPLHLQQNKEQNPFFSHQRKLKQLVKKIKNQTKCVEDKVQMAKKTIIQCKDKRLKQKLTEKQMITTQLNEQIKKQVYQISRKIQQQEELIGVNKKQGTIYEPFITQYIHNKLYPNNISRPPLNISNSFLNISEKGFHNKSSQKSSSIARQLTSKLSQQKNSASDYFDLDHVQKNIEFIQTELGQVSCKLLSLQDKKRKITVKNLLRNRRLKRSQGHGCGFEQYSSNKSITLTTKQSSKMINQHKIKSQPKIQDKNNFFSSIFSIFSSPPQKSIQQKEEANQFDTRSSERKIPKIPSESPIQQEFQSSLQEVEDNETKLRMIQINSEILQIRQHISIMVDHNILDRIVAYVMKVKRINEELRPLIDQLIEVVAIFCQQNISNLINQSHQLNLSKLMENENLRFFMSIIQSKFDSRIQIIQKLLFQIKYSIIVAIKFLKKRISQIKDQYESFIEKDLSKDTKIKATQAQKSKTQVFIISLALDSLYKDINELITNKLQVIDEVFQNQITQFHKYIEEIKSGCSQGLQNVNSVIKASLESVEIREIKRILLSPKRQKFCLPQKDSSINGSQSWNQIKTQIHYRFFYFYEGLFEETFKVMSKK